MSSEFGPAISSFDPSEGKRKPRRKPRSASSGKREEAPRQSAFNRVVQLCAVRDRSRMELEQRLIKEGYPPQQIEEALQRAVDCNLVNDERFADAFIRARVLAGKGLRKVELDLAKHGIDPTLLEGWPQRFGLDDEAQIAAAVSLLQNHPPRCKDIRSGAYRKLMSKGYSGSIATQAIRRWEEEAPTLR